MAEEKTKVSKGVSASKTEATVVITPDEPKVDTTKGKWSKRSRQSTLDRVP